MTKTFNKISLYLRTTRFKAALWYSLIFLALEVVLGSVIYLYLQHTLNHQLDMSLKKQAEMIYHFVVESKVDLTDFKPDSLYSSQDELVYDLIFEAVALDQNNTFVQVNIKNKVIFRTGNLLNNFIRPPGKRGNEIVIYNYQDKKLSESNIRAAYLKNSDYEVFVAFPVSRITQTLDSLIDLYTVIAPVFLLLSIIGGALLSFGALRRIDQIIKETDKITTQNLDKSIEGEEYDDEYGRLVRTMNKMINRIKTSFEYMNQFSISASHELKTPLTILRGEIELALRSDKTPAQYKEILASNLEETIRLGNIIDRLFYLSKLELSKHKIEKATINIKPFIQTTLNSFTPLVQEKNMKFIFSCDNEREIYVSIEPDLFRQAVINIMENAIKYGKENTEILINCSNLSDDKTEITIINQAEEIPDEVLPKLFDRFYRAEVSRNRNLGGIGLGLSIVKSIIELHEGEIFIESLPTGEFKLRIII